MAHPLAHADVLSYNQMLMSTNSNIIRFPLSSRDEPPKTTDADQLPEPERISRGDALLGYVAVESETQETPLGSAELRPSLQGLLDRYNQQLRD